MKKFLYPILVVALVLTCLTACGKKKGNNFNQATNGAETTPTTEPKSGSDLYHACGGEVVLGDYSKLTKPAEYPGVSDEELEKEYLSQIAEALADYPNYVRDESRDGTEIKEGDVVNIDYVGKLDGEAFAGGSDEEFDLEIGSGTFIEDFENGLIGKTVGTTVDVDCKFPDDYHSEDLAGKTVTFTITINYVGQKKDEADDEYIRRLSRGTYQSGEDYKKELRSMMEESAKKEYEDSLYEEVIKQMIEISEFKTILDEDVAFYENDMKAYYESYASYYGMDVKEFVTEVGFSSYDAFLADCHENALQYVKEYMVLEAIAEKEGITVTPEIFDERVEGYMASASMTDKEAFIEEYSNEYLNYCILNDLALELLVENAKKN
ncbi:MAG: trigger factor [Lachnospiraceae bacterium]|nr:trigger factor [Lachnospiraceae bacterium]